MTASRQFARIFESPTYGQILITATTDDDGDPAIKCTVDSHPETLQPSAVTLSFDKDICPFEKLQTFDLVKAEAFAKSIADQINAWQISAATA